MVPELRGRPSSVRSRPRWPSFHCWMSPAPSICWSIPTGRPRWGSGIQGPGCGRLFKVHRCGDRVFFCKMMIRWWLRDDDDIIGIWGRETEVPAIKVGILEKQSFRVEKLEKGREAVGSWPTPNIYTYLYNIGGGSKPDNIHFPAILVWQKVARFWPLTHSHIASECPSYFDQELIGTQDVQEPRMIFNPARLIRAVIPYNENCLWYMYIYTYHTIPYHIIPYHTIPYQHTYIPTYIHTNIHTYQHTNIHT